MSSLLFKKRKIMVEVKWIKINTNIFDDEKILLIEAMPNKYEIITCWFKLLCLAGKQNNNGVFTLNDKIAYTDEMLASILRMPTTSVRMALDVFEQFEMIERINGVITIPNWEKHQQLDAYEKKKEYDRKYRAIQREKQREISSQNKESYDSHTTVGILDIDKEVFVSKDTHTNNEFVSNILVSKDTPILYTHSCPNRLENESNSDELDKLFDKFWASYPRKDNKKKCKQWFEAKSHNVTSELVDTMVKAIEKNKKFNQQWQNKQFIPMPLTWLNGERWNDEIDEPSSNTSNQPKLLEEI
jgi:predicted phage replisome organizer